MKIDKRKFKYNFSILMVLLATLVFLHEGIHMSIYTTYGVSSHFGADWDGIYVAPNMAQLNALPTYLIVTIQILQGLDDIIGIPLTFAIVVFFAFYLGKNG